MAGTNPCRFRKLILFSGRERPKRGDVYRRGAGSVGRQVGPAVRGTRRKTLDKLIDSIGWKREDIYISNIVKRRPPENRDPFPEELEAYRPYLTEEIETLNPKIIAPLGRYSMNYILPLAKISNDHGRVFWWGERLVIPLYHPVPHSAPRMS